MSVEDDRHAARFEASDAYFGHDDDPRDEAREQGKPEPSDAFAAALIAGLSMPAKSIPCRFFYDAAGSAL
ncbi:MAG TPA: hypothetical protein VNR88_02080, partial [Hyphomicrobium sp.]|nr:hypothetical protein [Hyphomicrobium sp.]